MELDKIINDMVEEREKREKERIDEYMKTTQNPVEKLQDWISDAKDIFWNASRWAEDNAKNPEAKQAAHEMMVALYVIKRAIDDNLEKIQGVE